MTPLEKALQMESERCKEVVFVNGWYYCKKSGKMLHPMCLTEDGRCRNKKSCSELKSREEA